MGTDGLRDPGEGGRHLASLLHRGRREGNVGSLPGEEVVAWLLELPVFPQFLQQAWRGRNDPVLASLPFRDAELPPLSVDLGDAKMGRFGQSQSG
jgi:hypothetical protein